LRNVVCFMSFLADFFEEEISTPDDTLFTYLSFGSNQDDSKLL
jgi:hypothetical protein